MDSYIIRGACWEDDKGSALQPSSARWCSRARAYFDAEPERSLGFRCVRNSRRPTSHDHQIQRENPRP